MLRRVISLKRSLLCNERYFGIRLEKEKSPIHIFLHKSLPKQRKIESEYQERLNNDDISNSISYIKYLDKRKLQRHKLAWKNASKALLPLIPNISTQDLLDISSIVAKYRPPAMKTLMEIILYRILDEFHIFSIHHLVVLYNAISQYEPSNTNFLLFHYQLFQKLQSHLNDIPSNILIPYFYHFALQQSSIHLSSASTPSASSLSASSPSGSNTSSISSDHSFIDKEVLFQFLQHIYSEIHQHPNVDSNSLCQSFFAFSKLLDIIITPSSTAPLSSPLSSSPLPTSPSSPSSPHSSLPEREMKNEELIQKLGAKIRRLFNPEQLEEATIGNQIIALSALCDLGLTDRPVVQSFSQTVTDKANHPQHQEDIIEALYTLYRTNLWNTRFTEPLFHQASTCVDKFSDVDKFEVSKFLDHCINYHSQVDLELRLSKRQVSKSGSSNRIAKKHHKLINVGSALEAGVPRYLVILRNRRVFLRVNSDQAAWCSWKGGDFDE